jgi:hypothetical protein
MFSIDYLQIKRKRLELDEPCEGWKVTNEILRCVLLSKEAGMD